MYKTRWIIALLIAILTTASTLANDLATVRQRRKARREQVTKIVKAGEATEGNDGFLVPKSGVDEKTGNVIKAENADRKTGYTAIAKANNKSAEEIGKKAAEMMRARAKK